MMATVPLLILVVGAYNFMALTGAGVDWQLFQIGLPSGVLLPFRFGDVLVMVGIVLLYLEIWKSTRASNSSIVDHLLSLALFVIALVQFLVLQGFGTAVYATILCLTFVDVIAGFTVSISSARRDVDFR